MYLAVDPSVSPVGQSDWQANVSVLQAHPHVTLSKAHLEEMYSKAWVWSRQVKRAAQELAQETTDPFHKMLCERWAVRHGGVWQGINKLTREHPETKKEMRALAPVRSDAGDATCPTWLEREARKRKEKAEILLAAIGRLGYHVKCARVGGLTRMEATSIRDWFMEAILKAEVGILGFDMLITPDSETTVSFNVIGVFTYQEECSIVPPSMHHKIEFRNSSSTAMFDEPYNNACRLGPKSWLIAQLASYSEATRARDRVTCGIMYGKKAKQAIIDASVEDKQGLTPDVLKIVNETEHKVMDALNIAQKAAEAGSLYIAKTAANYARSYVQAVSRELEGYPTVLGGLRFLAEFDLFGIPDAPILQSVYDSLMKELWKLPQPPMAKLNPWRSIGTVPCHDLEAIKLAVRWMRFEEE